MCSKVVKEIINTPANLGVGGGQNGFGVNVSKGVAGIADIRPGRIGQLPLWRAIFCSA